MKQYLIFFMFLLAACPLAACSPVAQDTDSAKQSPADENQDDPIAAMLEFSKTNYKNEIAASYDLLLKAIDAEIEKTENNASMSVEVQLKKLKELKSVRQAFVKNSENTPTIRTLKSASSKYKRQLAASQKTLEDVFDVAADLYRKPPLKNFEAAGKVLAEKKAYFKNSGRHEVAVQEVAGGEVGEASGFTPEFNSKNWIASAPKLVENQNGQLQIAAGKDGNLVLTKKNNIKLPTVKVTLSAKANTDAYLILHARQKDGKWLGVTSRIRFVDGKIMAGGQRSDFREDTGRIKAFKVDEFFELELKIHEIDGRDDALMVKSMANSKFTGAIAYSLRRSGQEGAVGFVVNQGAISVKSFELETDQK